MKHKITALFLIVAIISCNFSRFFVYAGFELNRNYIAAKLCENRNKPWLHCNGKCYLAKKIKQAEEKQNAAERESQKSLFQDAFIHQNQGIKFYTLLLRVILPPNSRTDLPKSNSSIFRPPQLA